MSAIITITNAGLAKLVNATGTGTAAVAIAAVGVSASIAAADPTLTALPGEIKRLTTVSGEVISASTIHVSMQDSSTDAYTANSFGIYLSDGTLFAVYGQATPIYTKTAASIGMLAVDIALSQGTATSITFGNADFINPPASQTAMGVVQLATQAQASAGTDASDVLTPATAAAALLTWLLSRDGSGSGIDADLLDGLDSTAFLKRTDTSMFGSNSNGYWEQRANGVLEQWGPGPAVTAEGQISVTFPKAYTDVNSIMPVLMGVNSAAAGNRDVWPQLVSWTLTGAIFEMQWTGNDNTSPALPATRFRVIGR